LYQRAARAVSERRFSDADQLIRDLPIHHAEDAAWRGLILGRLLCTRSRVAAAQEEFLRSAAAAAQWALEESTSAEHHSNAWRLAADALHELGRTLRRLDRPDAALRMHACAYDLRCRVGSWHELWDSAYECGLDARIAAAPDIAASWFSVAEELADHLSTDPHEHAARSALALAHALRDLQAWDDAFLAVLAAQHHQRTHDPASVEAARMQLAVAELAFHHVESLYRREADTTNAALEQAIRELETARLELHSFGPIADVDCRHADALLDLAHRLHEELDHPWMPST
jgi:hypothetical protein